MCLRGTYSVRFFVLPSRQRQFFPKISVTRPIKWIGVRHGRVLEVLIEQHSAWTLRPQLAFEFSYFGRDWPTEP